MLGPEHLRTTRSDAILMLYGITLASSSSIRNLVIFDQDLPFDSQIKQVSKSAFFDIHNIAKKNRHSLIQNDTSAYLCRLAAARNGIPVCDSSMTIQMLTKVIAPLSMSA